MTGQSFWFKFLVRWAACSLGLWIAAALLGHRLTYDESFWVLVIAGLILAVVNSIIKPVVILLSLPAILLTLGLFMLVVNGLMVALVAWLYGPLQVANFWSAMLAGLVIGVVNFLVSTIIESSKKGVR